jgi:type I restriction enzyme S subunit
MAPDAWKSALVSDICRLQNGRGFTPEDWDTHGLPIIRIQNLNGGAQYNYFSGVPEDDWLVHPGQMLFAWAGTKGVSFGPTIWTGEIGVLNQHIFRVFPKSGVEEQWLYYCLQNVTARIERKAHGFKATLVHVKKSEIDNQGVSIPPLHEQRAISTILATWDRAITTIEKLIKNSEAKNHALVQQLFWGGIRLPGYIASDGYQHTIYGKIPRDWRFPKIGTLAKETSTRNSGDLNLPVLACSKHVGFVRSLEYFKKKIYSDDTSTYKVAPRGTFGFPANHIEEGSIGYQNVCDAGLVSPIYCLFRTDNSVCDEYLYRLFKTDHYRQIFSAATNSSVDRRGSLRWREFSKLHVPLPSVEEQRAISRVLDAANATTTNLTRQLEAVRDQRTALMQQLLTGKRRVSLAKRQEAALA